MRPVLKPVISRRPGRRVFDHVHQPAVGEDAPAFPDGGQHLAGGFVVGRIEAGEPGSSVLGPAVGIDLGRMIGRGRDKLDSPLGIGEDVTDGKRRSFSVIQPFGQLDRERSRSLIEGQRRFLLVPDAFHLELGGVENDPVQVIAERRQRHVRPAEDGFGAFVETEGQPVVEGVVIAVSFEALRALGEVKGLGRERSGRERGQEKQRGQESDRSAHGRLLGAKSGAHMKTGTGPPAKKASVPGQNSLTDRPAAGT